MAVTRGLLVHLEAAPGKGEELRALLEQGREMARAESGTVTWYAFQLGDTAFGVFDTFETDGARQDHLDGEIPRALASVGAELLARDPEIRPVDIVAVK
jgi:quinol monooxygenase YgiN